jgi:hypothetical protein
MCRNQVAMPYEVCMARASMVYNLHESNSSHIMTRNATLFDDPSNCANDTSACGCTTSEWVECAITIGQCATVCVGTWGAGCLTCLSVIKECQDCTCYYVCKYEGPSWAAAEMCKNQYVNCTVPTPPSPSPEGVVVKHSTPPSPSTEESVVVKHSTVEAHEQMDWCTVIGAHSSSQTLNIAAGSSYQTLNIAAGSSYDGGCCEFTPRTPSTLYGYFDFVSPNGDSFNVTWLTSFNGCGSHMSTDDVYPAGPYSGTNHVHVDKANSGISGSGFTFGSNVVFSCTNWVEACQIRAHVLLNVF